MRVSSVVAIFGSGDQWISDGEVETEVFYSEMEEERSQNEKHLA